MILGYGLEGFYTPLMEGMGLFPPEICYSVWAWRAPVPFLKDYANSLKRPQIKVLIRKRRYTVFNSTPYFLQPSGLCVSCTFYINVTWSFLYSGVNIPISTENLPGENSLMRKLELLIARDHSPRHSSLETRVHWRC